MKDKIANCKTKYICLFGVLGIAIQEAQVPPKQKTSSEETKELAVFKEERGHLHQFF